MCELLAAMLRSNDSAVITVEGISMLPTLQEGDTILISKSQNYELGDILVFAYPTEELLVHRLIQKTENTLYCKGDNAFRLEEVSPNQVYGKVVMVNGLEILPWPLWKVNLSYAVHCEFINCQNVISQTRQTQIYKLYNEIILINEGAVHMTYRKNESMEFIQADASSLAVFDSESGDAHFFDETGIDILNILSTPHTLEALIGELCSIYAVKPEEIQEDVEEFVSETVSKKVVLAE